MGDVSSLFPDGITSMHDLPHTFQHALTFALQVLSWDELPGDERPPRDIWLDTRALYRHFKEVDAKRKRELDPDSDWSHIDGPVERNPAADELRAAVG